MHALQQELLALIEKVPCPDEETRRACLARCDAGMLTRAEDPRSHFCVYFTPFDPVARRVFFVHHKKSGLWLSPGGHLEPEESILVSLNREMGEELGLSGHFRVLPSPSFCAVTHIAHGVQPCREHYDIWFFFPIDPTAMTVGTAEFHAAQWWMPTEAREHVRDPNNLLALAEIERRHFASARV